MRKKLIAGFLIMLAFMCFSVTAFALTEGDWEFQLSDDGVTVTGYLGEGGEVVVPETIYGKKVTKIELDAGKYFDRATSLIIEAKVTELGDLFSKDAKVQTVTLPEGLKSLYSTFSECKYLKSVNIPSTVTQIGYCSFNECTALEEISFPEGLEYIEHEAFARSGLKEVYLPYIKGLGPRTFRECENLKKLTFADGYTLIPDYAFEGCTSLEEVILPHTVEEIGYYAFLDCTSLKQIILPTSLKELCGGAFKNCDSLEEVVIPYGTQSANLPFSDCDNLKRVYVPDTVQGYALEESNNCIIYCTANSDTAKQCEKYNRTYVIDNSVNTGINVYYNGERVSFHAYDQNPEIINSRTLVPLRAIFETMDAEVEWDSKTSTVTAKRGETEIKITIGEIKMYKDGKEIAVDVPAQIINSRTMIPVRVIAEAFGAEVAWNGNGNAVLINE